MSLTGVIASFATGTYVVTRSPERSFGSDGRPDSASSSTFSVVASVQPPTGREAQRLPEGIRADEVRIVYVHERLHTRDDGYEPDIVAIAGEDYEVFRVETWDAFGDVHYRCWAKKVLA
jgi:hypothetical protein